MDTEGLVTAEAVAAAMTDETVLVTVMHSNNEIGALLPVSAIAAACKAHGVIVHTDAAQSVGKVPVKVRVGASRFCIASRSLYYVTCWAPPTDENEPRVCQVDDICADLVTVVGHKFGAPKVLACRRVETLSHSRPHVTVGTRSCA